MQAAAPKWQLDAFNKARPHSVVAIAAGKQREATDKAEFKSIQKQVRSLQCLALLQHRIVHVSGCPMQHGAAVGLLHVRLLRPGSSDVHTMNALQASTTLALTLMGHFLIFSCRKRGRNLKN